jgi:hypothetical protein
MRLNMMNNMFGIEMCFRKCCEWDFTNQNFDETGYRIEMPRLRNAAPGRKPWCCGDDITPSG